MNKVQSQTAPMLIVGKQLCNSNIQERAKSLEEVQLRLWNTNLEVQSIDVSWLIMKLNSTMSALQEDAFKLAIFLVMWGLARHFLYVPVIMTTFFGTIDALLDNVIRWMKMSIRHYSRN
nr:hypothetical protein [Tanacetum cinerariifolium]